MRQLASVQIINDIRPIENADRIEQASILGWNVVVEKNLYQTEDRVIYVETDSILPEDNENFSFMEKHKYRVRSIRLRGTLSQGLVFPLSILPPEYQNEEVGTDVTDVLGIEKYEPSQKFYAGKPAGNFPSFIPKTDEIRLQSIPWVLELLRGQPAQISMKCDGTSCSIVNKDGEFFVCSRNLKLTEDDESVYWKIAKKYDLENKLSQKIFSNIAIQGEIMGPGIQGNPMHLNDFDMFVFDVFDLNRQVYLSYELSREIIHALGMKPVPLVVANYIFDMTLEELLTAADGNYPMTAYPREGIVVRPMTEIRTEREDRLSFKVISNKYLLKTGQ